MCGIIGIWRKDSQPVDRRLLQDATACLKHRGPNDEGTYIDGLIGLGHRRLSILDLSVAGHQPMVSADGRHVLVFNGEIYNFKELADHYCQGVTWQSTSDTEVLLHLLIQKGVDALPLLRGMFVFAYWDTTKKELLLARDPFGKKPLYYINQEQIFAFASEPKALRQLHHPLSLQADTAAKYFLYEYVPTPATGFKNIEQLPMGHYLRVTQTTAEITAWWQPSFVPKLELTEKAALRTLDKLLGQAVERRLIADVPVGIFLSGGLDSTTILWYMRQTTAAPIHSFSVSFHEQSFNEGDYARTAATSLGAIHHDQIFDVPAFFQAIAELMPIIDIPFGDASLLPTYMISKYARQHITVALDGDGSDELFGGYGTFQAAAMADQLPTLPDWIQYLLGKVSHAIPTSYTNFSLDFKIKSFLKGLGYPLSLRNQIWLGSFSERELAWLLTPAYQKYIPQVFDDITKLAPTLKSLENFDQVSLLTIHHYLQNDILVKLDRATMATGIESRTPFLDVDVAEFVMRLPVSLKKNKYLLKKLMTGRIPADIITRPKKGFGVPLGFWLRSTLYPWATTVLDADKLKADGIFNPTYVVGLLREHKQGRFDHRKKLWTLIAWQLWYDRWIIGRSA